jgi:hypothetical protein
LIEDTDWAGLQHAYGPATDTPLRLVELLHDEPDIQAHALGQLDMSVLHQGSLCSATAPAVLFVAAILDHPRTLARHKSCFPWDDRVRPLRAALLEWLGQVADAAAYGEPDQAAEHEEPEEPQDAEEYGTYEEHAEPGVVEAVRATRVVVYRAVAPHLQAADPDIRAAALETVSALFEGPELADRVVEATRLLREGLGHLTERRERAVVVTTIGAWGQDTSDLLHDPDPAVRACAALAGTCADNPRATREILQALRDPATVDAWFRQPLPYTDGPLRHALLAAAIQRATFEELLPAALAMVPLASNLTAAHDWGPLLGAAFPRGYVEGNRLTAAQHRYLSALVERDAVWRFGHLTATWLQDVGLPADRNAVAELLKRAS